MKEYIRENILRVDTYVLEFLKENEKLNNEFVINEISLEILKTIFTSKQEDDELFLSYDISELQVEMINKNLNSPILFDFEKFDYNFQRYGEYK